MMMPEYKKCGLDSYMDYEEFKQRLKQSWDNSLLGEIPNSTGYYWIFIPKWRITRVYFDKYDVLRCTYPNNMRVEDVHRDRWGGKF